MFAMRRPSLLLFATVVTFLFLLTGACGGESGSPTSAPSATQAPAYTMTPAPEATISPTPTAPPAASTATATPAPGKDEPTGFPIAPETILGVVTGEAGSRSIDWEGGTSAAEYSRDLQVSGDADAANSMGWNCRTHVEYEGVPAVDWYIPTGTPIYATMDGQATLYIVSLPNAFGYYGADREPFLGNPDRSRALLSPFPGPGGGKGVFVEVVNEALATEYAHFDLEATLATVPAGAYLDGYHAGYDFQSDFNVMRPFTDATPIASWPVLAGDVIGYSGDSGYSEAPHLHYTIRRVGGALLCPTQEDGFAEGGWLFR